MMPLVLVALALLVGPLETRGRRLIQQRSATRPRDGPRAGGLRGLAARLTARVNGGELHAVPAVAADIDLYAACLASGLSPAVSAGIVGGCSTSPARETWRTIASLLAIGVSPERAWADARDLPGLRDVARLACGSHHSGAGFAEAAAQVAEAIRHATADRATATAERAGVLIAMPLTLCFLPAFFLLGLAPVLVGVAQTIISSHTFG
ncbi:type II secretion system F family protein [Corynebacterium sp. zg-331]|uniref:type II secretion system F family protein n=1 Tax=unclassified Corynebacterium TaxID=2624378 RepID=UPI00128DA877|nr:MULTISPECIES: type II secretion system F family protein [unclassified Corynebacterium]MBC3186560.1 type II secretion system F family protein [Corynebacterium sp. zg-331]MPV53044.1 type II secretion protein F [Corynebacterium sp. zg331]